MMPAAKFFDPVVGVDVHIVMIPSPLGPIPTPIPHPFVGMLFDPFELVPGVGGTVYIQGMMRAVASTSGNAMPPHIPMGAGFGPPLPSNSCEMFMGSSTVLMDGYPAAYSSLPVLTCNSFGIPAPFRPKKSPKPSLMLPTSFVVSIPCGMPVLIGGAPTISMSALAMKGVMSGLGKGLKKLKKCKLSRAAGKKLDDKLLKPLSNKLHKKADKIMNKRFKSLSNAKRQRVHDRICSFTGHPVDVASGKVITDNDDFILPGPIPLVWNRRWSSANEYNGPLGQKWTHSYDVLLCVEDGLVLFRMEDGRPLMFEELGIGEKKYNRSEKMELHNTGNGYELRKTEERLTLKFTQEKDHNGAFRLQTICDDLGNQITLQYNGLWLLSAITDSAGRTLTFQNNPRGKITQIHLNLPNQTTKTLITYEYDQHDNQIQATDALENSWYYHYKDHLLTKETNRNGLSFYFEWQHQGTNAQCIHTWGDGGIYDHKLSYNDMRSWTVVENSLGHKSTHHHRGGIVHKVDNPQGHSSETFFTEYNEVLIETDESKRSVVQKYDDRGNTNVIMQPDGKIIKVEYENDLPTKVVDTIGGEWLWKYDDHGRLVEKQDPLERITRNMNTMANTWQPSSTPQDAPRK
jgi:YD repeat-containing protein